MKLYEVSDTEEKWTDLPIPELMDKLRDAPSSIMFVKNPPEEVQLYVIMRRPSLIGVIQNPTDHAIATALTNSKWFLSKEDYSRYIEVVHDIFETNELLRKKWLRYGERKWNERTD